MNNKNNNFNTAIITDLYAKLHEMTTDMEALIEKLSNIEKSLNSIVNKEKNK